VSSFAFECLKNKLRVILLFLGNKHAYFFSGKFLLKTFFGGGRFPFVEVVIPGKSDLMPTTQHYIESCYLRSQQSIAQSCRGVRLVQELSQVR
jgi:hypothetical protein